MTKDEWRIHHGFTDADMDRIVSVMLVMEGKITNIFNKPLDYQIIQYEKKGL